MSEGGIDGGEAASPAVLRSAAESTTNRTGSTGYAHTRGREIRVCTSNSVHSVDRPPAASEIRDATLTHVRRLAPVVSNLVLRAPSYAVFSQLF
jgi:hypothetical protein